MPKTTYPPMVFGSPTICWPACKATLSAFPPCLLSIPQPLGFLLPTSFAPSWLSLFSLASPLPSCWHERCPNFSGYWVLKLANVRSQGTSFACHAKMAHYSQLIMFLRRLLISIFVIWVSYFYMYHSDSIITFHNYQKILKQLILALGNIISHFSLVTYIK